MAEPEEALEDRRDVSRKPVTEHLGAALALAASLSVMVSFIYLITLESKWHLV